MSQLEETTKLYGIKSLSNEQLLVLCLGNGATKYTGKHRWDIFDYLHSRAQKPGAPLKLQALSELIRRGKANNDKCIRSISDIENLYHEMKFLKKELVKGIYVNTRLEIIFEELLAMGSLSASSVGPREVMRPGIQYGAHGFFLLHNHPSGDPTPSDEDLISTRQILKAAQIMGIKLLDHIILAKKGIFSFSEQKLL